MSTVALCSGAIYHIWPAAQVTHPLAQTAKSLLTHVLPPQMPKPNSDEAFFKRAREKGQENNKDNVNGDEVRNELADGTKHNYCRALTLWHR